MEEKLERFSLSKSMQPKGILQRVGLIGCGSIGQEIALHVSQKGIEVVFIDLSEELVQASLKSMGDQLDELINKWGMTDSEKKLVMQRITGSTKYEHLHNCDIIIETILSKKPGTSLEERMRVFERVESVVSRDTVITSNTATLMISDLSAALKYPDRAVGMHFLSPISRINIVEVVRHAGTSNEAFEMVKKFCQMIGKKVVECSESPGNISTRMIVTMINEACSLLLEGVSSVTDIDEVMMEATGFEFGPFELADKYGIDKIHKWMENLYRELGDLRFKPSPIIKRMVRANMCGRHVGEGFYFWEEGVKKVKPGSIRTLGR
ncbi:MAG TPA: 3-hydroxyacyl-CoA dehydrogenase family protein [Bacteroidales bacterium]|nr:3-hydroxyacyl-CoA dehydrogenase family protein [Bacteroidales bacterium]